jgi:hypothetical protein
MLIPTSAGPQSDSVIFPLYPNDLTQPENKAYLSVRFLERFLDRSADHRDKDYGN